MIARQGGKFLAKGTSILMFDRSFKNVEDIIVGNQIMGNDSTPRNVLLLASARERMWRVTIASTRQSARVASLLLASVCSAGFVQGSFKGASVRHNYGLDRVASESQSRNYETSSAILLHLLPMHARCDTYVRFAESNVTHKLTWCCSVNAIQKQCEEDASV